MTRAPIPPEVEDGWVTDHDGIHFMERNGPIWYRRGEDRVEVGFLAVEETHGNNQGIMHGGMIMSFADFALGHAVWYAHDRAPVVTIQMDVKFVAAGIAGDWIHCTPEIVRRTRSITFIRGDILSGDRLVATASGVWKAVGK
ncbi:PaaI family thioesterase [Rhodobacterales bacterium HKCCE2091]|nr:PaaI family thioesterase [Rhodobacterales bacterium HKCCE2091]